MISSDFLSEWLGPNGPFALGAIHPDVDDDHHWLTCQSLAEVEGFVAEHQNAGRNVYFQANLIRPDLGSARAKREHVAVALCVQVEIDPPEECSSPEALEKWQSSELERLSALEGLPPPSAFYFSGSGFVLLWRLSPGVVLRPLDNAELVESVNRGLVRALAGDPQSTDVSRLLRLPGTMNFPSAGKLEKGRTGPTESEVISLDVSRRAPLSAFPSVSRASGGSAGPIGSGPSKSADFRAAAQALAEAWPAHGKHAAHLALAGALARGGWDEEEITEFLVDVAELDQPGNGLPSKRRTAARSSIAKVDGGTIRGWPSLIEQIGEPAVAAARAALGFKDPSAIDEDLFAEFERRAGEAEPETNEDFSRERAPAARVATEPEDPDLAGPCTSIELRETLVEAGRRSNRALSPMERRYVDSVAKQKPLTSQPDDDAELARRRALAAVCRAAPATASDQTIASFLARYSTTLSTSTLIEEIRAARKKAARPRAAPPPDAADAFSVDQTGQNAGRPRKDDQRNWAIALTRLGVTLRYDEFAYRLMIERDGSIEAANDRHIKGLMFEIERTFGFRPPKDPWYDYCDDVGFKNAFHPVKDFYDSLPEWDGVPRLENWLVRFLGVEDSAYTRAVGRILIVAMVRRVKVPGDKYDEMVVLYGPQGAEKSSALKALLPKEEWFTDGLNMDEDPKVVLEQTAGKLLVEVQELKTSSKFDERNNKAMLSRQSDRAREAYGRKTMERLRQFVLCGSTNKREFLRDPTGNRRFWPFLVGQIDLPGLIAERDLLWAEAVALEAQGMSIRLPKELWAEAARVQEQFRLKDAVQIRLTDLLRGTQGAVQIGDLYKYLFTDRLPNDGEHAKMIDALTAMGFERNAATDTQTETYVRGAAPFLPIEVKEVGVGRWSAAQRGSSMKPVVADAAAETLEGGN